MKRDGINPFSNSLNFIRLILASTVIVSHDYGLGGYGQVPHFLGNTPGGWAVAFFFCISGYLITASKEHNSLGDFTVKRIARLFPAYIVCHLAIVFIFVPLALSVTNGSITSYLSSSEPTAYLLANINPALHIGDYNLASWSWNDPLYTLQFEFLGYLLIGFILCLPQKWRFKCILALFVLATVVQLYPRFARFFGTDFTNHYDGYNYVRLLPLFLFG